ncbi:MAG: TatD family hydrolase [Pyrinomonadaceae bacterium]
MFVDSHAHIDGPQFDLDRDAVIQRAVDNGVGTILNVGTGDPHAGTLERAVAVGEKYERIYTAIGVHPHDARYYDDEVENKILSLATGDRIVSWGEIGLDFHYDNSPRDLQLTVFERQLRAARRMKLPVIIHTREAEAETIAMLQRECGPGEASGVFHCFSGTRELASAAIELGFFVSFSGILTFKKAYDLRLIAKEIPLEHLLIETDCPFLAPVPFRGKRNEPAHVVEVARCLAELTNRPLQDIGRITGENFARLFNVALHQPPNDV